MTSPKISVLVPVYNGERYLAECLDSILSQNFKEMEILIADDGSTDSSPEIVQNYARKDSRIRFWKNQKNFGLTENFNYCLKAARGDYIKFVLQDDVLITRTALSKLADLLDADRSVSLVASASYVIDEHSQVIDERRHFQMGRQDGKQVIKKCMECLTNLVGEPSAVMFRRTHGIRGFDTGLKHLVDLEMWYHLLENGQWSYSPEILCAFRRHDAQQTTINQRTIPHGQEDQMIYERYSTKPWFQGIKTKQLMFSLTYSFRKFPNPPEVIAKLRRELGRGWYCLLWLRRKMNRPFGKLCRWLKKR